MALKRGITAFMAALALAFAAPAVSEAYLHVDWAGRTCYNELRGSAASTSYNSGAGLLKPPLYSLYRYYRVSDTYLYVEVYYDTTSGRRINAWCWYSGHDGAVTPVQYGIGTPYWP